ncbi:MAG: hypothetical protein RIF41_12620 [Polyangiaceae bacterium]
MDELTPTIATDGTIHQARLSPDGARLAFVIEGSADAGLYAGPVDGAAWRKLVGYPSFSTPEIAWSSDGRMIAYRVVADPPGYDDQIGYVLSTERGEVNRLDGQAFAWARKGTVIYALDGARMALVRYDLAKGTSRHLSEFLHHYDARFTPRVVPSPDGERITFTSRNVLEDTTRVFVVERREGEVDGHLLTWIPGADVHVFPFWSPKGVSLGMYMVHEALDTTGLVLIKRLEGEGEIVYQRDGLDVAASPAWYPDGASLVIPRDTGWTRLDLGDGTSASLGVDATGEARFDADGHLWLEGTDRVRKIG